MKIKLIVVFLILASACKDKREKTKPEFASITESVYASGIVKSKSQYELYSTVNGIIDSLFVSEGDTVHKGDKILVSTPFSELAINWIFKCVEILRYILVG